MFKTRMRPAFSLVELILSFVILALVMGTMYRFWGDANESYEQRKEFAFYSKFENAVKRNFVNILDAYEAGAGRVATDGTRSWGWSNLTRTNPYPVYSAPQTLTYYLQSGSTRISAANRTRLIQEITASLSGICKVKRTNSAQIDFTCGRLRSIAYGGASSATAGKTSGGDIDPRNPPTVTVGYRRESKLGNVTAASFTNRSNSFSMDDVFSLRKNYSVTKIAEIRKFLKGFSNMKLARELQNAPSGGLNSIDDEFVPWIWEVIGRSGSSADWNALRSNTTSCSRNGSGVCGNLSGSTWPGGTIRFGRIARRITAYGFHGAARYNVDGFNNQLMVYPVVSLCSTSNYTTCSIGVPAVPRDNYLNFGRPPYTSVIFNSFGANSNASAPEYLRSYVGY